MPMRRYNFRSKTGLWSTFAGLTLACLVSTPSLADHVDPQGWSLAPPNQPLLDAKRNAQNKRYSVTYSRYSTPNVMLTDALGNDQKLASLLDSGKPTVLQFIFTSCSTICPVLTATVAGAQTEIASASTDYQIVAITIDPEYDTPSQLRAYATRMGADSHWTFLTGSKSDIDSVLKAFDAVYRGDNKMYHRPYTYLRTNPDQPWERIDGLISAATLGGEYRAAVQRTSVKH